jgi:hypothetical protein
MSALVYATEITSEGEKTMRVRVAANMLDARIDLDVVVETQNADIALEHAQDSSLAWAVSREGRRFMPLHELERTRRDFAENKQCDQWLEKV